MIQMKGERSVLAMAKSRQQERQMAQERPQQGETHTNMVQMQRAAGIRRMQVDGAEVGTPHREGCSYSFKDTHSTPQV